MIAFFAAASAAVWSAICWDVTCFCTRMLVALGGDRRDVVIGLGARQRGPGLSELLVEIGRVDRGQHLAGLHGGADILVPALQIAVDARIDRGLGIGLDIAGQYEFLLGIAARELGERDGGDRLCVRPLHEVLRCCEPGR